MAAGRCYEHGRWYADLVIRNGKIVSPDAVFEGSIAIKDGRVLAVGADAAMPETKESFDARGLYVLPGAIDDHVHFRDPGYPHKEDWESGTAAAAFGGVTCVFDMPNTIPPTGTGEILAAKHKIAASKAHIDFGLYGLLGEDTIANVPDLVKGGVIGFKLYMGNTFGKIASPDTGATLECFEVAAATGKRVSLHAENNDIMERRQKRLMAAGKARSMGASGGAAQCGGSRSGQPRRHPGRMDRRAHQRPAYFDGGRIAPVARGQGARRRYYRRDLPALSHALDRRL